MDKKLIVFILPTLVCLNFLLFSIFLFVKTNSEVPGIMIYEELQFKQSEVTEREPTERAFNML